MNCCNNCGRHSHCGTALYEDFKDGDNNTINIKVCEQCRCQDCQTKDTNNG